MRICVKLRLWVTVILSTYIYMYYKGIKVEVTSVRIFQVLLASGANGVRRLKPLAQ